MTMFVQSLERGPDRGWGILCHFSEFQNILCQYFTVFLWLFFILCAVANLWAMFYIRSFLGRASWKVSKIQGKQTNSPVNYI